MALNSDCNIANIFDNATVFITGGSGFIGKITIDKILKVAPDVKRIYVLLRPKRQKSLEERTKEFFDYPCFDGLKLKHPNYINKIEFLSGDVAEISLGLSAENWEKLVNEVNIILNMAADVRFNNHIRNATYCNVRSVQEILKLAKEARQFKSFVHVSTAYSNYMHGREVINEEFYKPGMSAEALYNILDVFDDEQLTAITPTLIGHWPNTYSYTKCIAEDLVKKEFDNLPISIVRPGIIISTTKEPIPGWVDNFYGIIGVTIGIALGVLKIVNCKTSNRFFAVPCDYTMNVVLAAAWHNMAHDQSSQKLRIFNYVGSRYNICTYGDFQAFGRKHIDTYVTMKAVTYPRIYLFENYYLCKVLIFLWHTIPAYMADAVLFCLGKKPFAVKKIGQINELLAVITYFSVTKFNFATENVEKLWNIMDETNKKMFNFNMDDLDFTEYWHSAYDGGIRYLLKESPNDLPKAKRRNRILYIIDLCLCALLIYVLIRFLVMPILNLI